MKRVSIVAVVVVLLLAVGMSASASENNWRFNIAADNGAGMHSTSAQLGVMTGSKDPLPSDVVPLSDSGDNKWVASQPELWTVAGIFDNRAWNTDIKSDLKPWDSAYASQGAKKVWDLRVAGAGGATGNTIRLRFLTVTDTVLPPAQLTYSAGPPEVKMEAMYWLRMVNNRGVAGSPANGTLWAIPVPTAHSATPYFTLTLPALNISVAKSEEKLIAEGYAMEFYQTPEPSSLLALGAGLTALAGFASRRRRG